MAADSQQSTLPLFAVGALIVAVALGALLATRSPNDITETIEMQRTSGVDGTGDPANLGSSDSTDPAEEPSPSDLGEQSDLSERCTALARTDPSSVSITLQNGELALTIDGEVVDLETLRDCLPDDLGAILDGGGLPDLDTLPGLENLPDFAEDFEIPDMPCPDGMSPNPEVPQFELPPELDELLGDDFDFNEFFESLPPLCTE